MSLSRKSDGPHGPHRGHVARRHRLTAAPAGPPGAPPGTPPAAAAITVPIRIDGHHIGELHVPAGTDQMLIARALRQLAVPAEWAQLGARLAALGPHRLPIAARAATAAAGGGRSVTAEEEERIAQWFGGIVDEAIQRGGLPAAVAIWTVLEGDNHADPVGVRTARCPAMAEVPPPPAAFAFEPGEPGGAGEAALDPDEVGAFLAKLRAAAPRYVHTAVACASEDELHDLRGITAADARALEELRPWGVDLGAEGLAAEALEDARSMLTYRHLSNTEACSGFADWAQGFAGMVAEHALSPVLRIGAVAWLARVALRAEGADAASAVALPRSEAGRASQAPMDEADEAGEGKAAKAAKPEPSPDRAPHVRWMARQGLALNAAGWKVTEADPGSAGPLMLWRVTIERYDQEMTMTLRDALDPEVALEELLRYVQADAK